MKYLVHADGAIPNLALMRLASYYRARGETVRLVRGYGQRQLWDPPGEVLGSSIFQFSARIRKRIETEWGPVRWGGTGVSLASSLSEIDPSVDWDSVRPDYADYPDDDRSVGFTQRGCRLRCGFCVVPKKEGRPKSVATLWDIWRGGRAKKKLLLLDNDFFGQQREEWRARLAEAREGGFRICLTQGINVRLIDEEAARELATVEYRDQSFHERVIYTAWDNLREERRFRAGVATLASGGIPATHLRVFMLIGYEPGETWDAILYRFEALKALGCEPYPMPYDPPGVCLACGLENDSSLYRKCRKCGAALPGNLLPRLALRAFGRWAIRGMHKVVPWKDYRDRRKEAA
jgi:hypothetical protein